MTYRPYERIIANGKPETLYVRDLLNNTLNPIAAFTPVRANGSGMSTIDLTDPESVNRLIGVINSTVLPTFKGDVVTYGRIENYNQFSDGDIVYISKTGVLTNVRPQEGMNSFISGDYVVKIGKIVKNRSNVLNQDLLVQFEIIGRL